MRTIRARLGNRYFFTRFAYLLILCLCGVKALPADTDTEPVVISEHRAIKAIRTETPPTIDGKLDDVCWQHSAKTGELIQFEPQRGEPATQPTTIYLAYDANKLYVAFECFKTDMDNLAANQTRRDSFFFSDDHVEILIDTFLDGRNCYAFALNALGTQTDRRLINEGANRRSGQSNIGTAISWDCDWQGQAVKGTDRWTAEFAIPFAELRFSKKRETATWGINFWRNDEALAEEQTWADLGERQYAVSRFGRMTDLPITDLVTKRPMKLKPYATLKPQVSQASDSETAFEVKPDAGIDLRYPIKDFTIDLTLNPDFAQIEADPDLVNLSDIPLRFPEKRPFFLEGNELFQMPLDLFYSRRVEDLVGGGKVIGKFSKYNLAFMGAVAGPENPDKEIETGELPLTNYNYSVLRLQRELGKTSSVGFLGVNKQRGGTYDRAGGMDARVRLPADVNLNLEYAREWKAGGLDMAESTADDLIFVQLDRRTNVFSLDAIYADIGEHFNPETGFVPRVDRRGLVIRSRYNKQYKGILERLRGEAEYERLANHAGELTNHRARFSGLIGVKDVFFFFGPEWYYHVNDDNKPFTDRTVRFFTGWFPPKYVQIRNTGSFGIRDDKDTFFIRPEITIRPTAKLSFEFILQRLHEKEQDALQWQLSEWTRRFIVNYQFAQRMYVRTSAEFTLEKERRVFALFAYEYRPESNFFIVYNDNRDIDGDTERIVFIKVAHLLKTDLF
ncbi:carbohydrate binding family 9 domain-containing protein [Candidatus Poribacteria bacterium]|nr:carbohydrate binding family 9 domain-containing protein [Candidatus Poribacteria bacterium]